MDPDLMARRFLRERWHAPRGSAGNLLLRHAWASLPGSCVERLCWALIEATSDDQRVARLIETGLLERLTGDIPACRGPCEICPDPEERWREWKALHHSASWRPPRR